MTQMTYDETMAYGAAQYGDVLNRLNVDGLPAEFIQTGGMNAAICVTLEAGYHLLITDQEDALSWERAQHQGWYVGLYSPEEGEEPIRWVETGDSSLVALRLLVDSVLGRAR